MATEALSIVPGARIAVRDVEWLVRKTEQSSRSGTVIHAVGLSNLVRDKEAIFIEKFEDEVEIINPKNTKLVPDGSSQFLDSRLYLDGQIRRALPDQNEPVISQNAAIDNLPFQFTPAEIALKAPRVRILIADDVGLGKTLQAGILTSELIRRGRGKRILVVTSKSMLVQFQKEFWTRFSIPLTRLDSEGIKKVQTKIPDNHNPFQYFDRTIISIDTLKSTYYSNRIREAWWDIIIIDEAQNVAERKSSKGGRSFRNRLAKNLSSRSDSLILLSATPHDGSKRSFASLMRMLDPTSIADPDNYGPEDIKGLFIRRFRTDQEVISDIREVGSSIPERETIKISSVATAAEENAYDKLDALELHSDSRKVRSSQLVKITLEKALFSSPCACLESIENRIKRIESQNSKKEAQEDGEDKLKVEESNADLKALRDFHVAVKAIGKEDFSKYAKMLEVLKEIKWTGKDKSDRLVIFTERIATLNWLVENLQKDLKFSDKQVVGLHGMMKDIDIQERVDDFGQENKPVRILVASDLASEGINLHHQSQKLIHFDIPWSLMTFQQRNGRIDRYGQESQPKMWYLLTESKNSKIQGDQRILEILIEKNENAEESIGDPSVFFGTNDAEEQEDQVADAIHQMKSAKDFSDDLDKNQSEKERNEYSAMEMLIRQQFEETTTESTEPKKSVISGYSGNNYPSFQMSLSLLSPHFSVLKKLIILSLKLVRKKK